MSVDLPSEELGVPGSVHRIGRDGAGGSKKGLQILLALGKIADRLAILGAFPGDASAEQGEQDPFPGRPAGDHSGGNPLFARKNILRGSGESEPGERVFPFPKQGFEKRRGIFPATQEEEPFRLAAGRPVGKPRDFRLARREYPEAVQEFESARLVPFLGGDLPEGVQGERVKRALRLDLDEDRPRVGKATRHPQGRCVRVEDPRRPDAVPEGRFTDRGQRPRVVPPALLQRGAFEERRRVLDPDLAEVYPAFQDFRRLGLQAKGRISAEQSEHPAGLPRSGGFQARHLGEGNVGGDRGGDKERNRKDNEDDEEGTAGGSGSGV